MRTSMFKTGTKFLTALLLCLAVSQSTRLFSAELKGKDYKVVTKEVKTEGLYMPEKIAAATVNGKTITEFDVIKRAMLSTYSKTLATLIEEQLISQEAAKRRIKISDRGVDERLKEIIPNHEKLDTPLKEFFEERIRIQMQKDELVKKIYKIRVKNKEIKEFFEKNKENLAKPERVKLRTILVKTEQEADDIIVAVNSGADFAKLAQLKSLDNSTKSKGGDLGYITKGLALPALEKAVFSQPVGGMTRPIETKLGYQIFYIDEKIPAQEAKYKELKSQIKDLLLTKKINAKYIEWLSKAKDKADIKILKKI